MQVPEELKVTYLMPKLKTKHTDGVDEVSVTGSPDDAIADTTYAGPESDASVGAVDVNITDCDAAAPEGVQLA